MDESWRATEREANEFLVGIDSCSRYREVKRTLSVLFGERLRMQSGMLIFSNFLYQRSSDVVSRISLFGV